MRVLISPRQELPRHFSIVSIAESSSFEKEDPIGKRFTAKFSPGPEDPPNWTIVGVINDTKQRGLAAEVTPEVTPLLPSGLDS